MEQVTSGSVLVIGSEGIMGTWACGTWASHPGGILHRSDPKLSTEGQQNLCDLVADSEIIIVSVPIQETKHILQSIIPLLCSQQLLIDLTSVKSCISEELYGAPCEVLSLHPMFSPVGRDDLTGERIVAINVKDGWRSQAAIQLLINQHYQVTQSTIEEHDQMMAVIQGLTHVSNLAIGVALQRLGIAPADTAPFSSPIYRSRLEIVTRILSQDPNLYAAIACQNPHTLGALKIFEEAFFDIVKAVEAKDESRFAEIFRDAARFLQK